MQEDPSQKNQNDLIGGLLNRCEVTNLPSVYQKYLAKYYGICRIEKMLDFNSYFTEKNIKRDIHKIQNLIIVSIYPEIFREILGLGKHIIGHLEEDEINSFDGIKCLISYERLLELLNRYRKKKIISKISSLKEIKRILCIQTNEISKFSQMLEKLAEEKQLFIEYINKNADERDKESTLDNSIKEDEIQQDMKIIFSGRYKHPSNRKYRIELITTIVIGGFLIFSLYFLIKTVFSN